MSVDENVISNNNSDIEGIQPELIKIKLLQQIKKELKDQTTLLQQILAKP